VTVTYVPPRPLPPAALCTRQYMPVCSDLISTCRSVGALQACCQRGCIHAAPVQQLSPRSYPGTPCNASSVTHHGP
jgi:hypothetical protein